MECRRKSLECGTRQNIVNLKVVAPKKSTVYAHTEVRPKSAVRRHFRRWSSLYCHAAKCFTPQTFYFFDRKLNNRFFIRLVKITLGSKFVQNFSSSRCKHHLSIKRDVWKLEFAPLPPKKSQKRRHGIGISTKLIYQKTKLIRYNPSGTVFKYRLPDRAFKKIYSIKLLTGHRRSTDNFGGTA